MKWTTHDIPDLCGKTVLITGANSGLGLESARAMAEKGAHVIMACRNPHKAEAAASTIRAQTPAAELELAELDLASLASVRTFAERVLARHKRLDVLLNNAGIMAIPQRRTVDGFEMQFGTNHLGHFALTARLFDLLGRTPGARIVNVASQAHVLAKMRWHDLDWQQGYAPWAAYGMSKLANLLFTRELARRIEKRGAGLLAAAAHPGYAATNLQYAAPEMNGKKLTAKVLRTVNPLLGQPPDMGALPQLYAAIATDVTPRDYIGPDGFLGGRGHPVRAWSAPQSRDQLAMQRLWDVSEQLTNTHCAALS